MALNTTTIRAQVVSHAQTLGLFGQVLAHEPMSAPGSGLTYAVWATDLGPLPLGSGLASTSSRLELTGRVYMPADTEPMDDVDLQVTGAADALIAAYSGDFELGGNVRHVDLLGAYGTALRARFGYLDIGTTTYRMATLTIPLVINDAWTQAP